MKRFALLLGLYACDSESTAPVLARPEIEASVSVRSTPEGCALDWRLRSSDTTITVSYEVGWSNSRGEFDRRSPHYFTGTFQKRLDFTDQHDSISSSHDYVNAIVWIPDHPGWGEIWGRPVRLRQLWGQNGPDCWLE